MLRVGVSGQANPILLSKNSRITSLEQWEVHIFPMTLSQINFVFMTRFQDTFPWRVPTAHIFLKCSHSTLMIHKKLKLTHLFSTKHPKIK